MGAERGLDGASQHRWDPSPGPAALHLIGFHRIITIIAITTRIIQYGRWKRQGSSQASREEITDVFITLPDKSRNLSGRRPGAPADPVPTGGHAARHSAVTLEQGAVTRGQDR